MIWLCCMLSPMHHISCSFLCIHVIYHKLSHIPYYASCDYIRYISVVKHDISYVSYLIIYRNHISDCYVCNVINYADIGYPPGTCLSGRPAAWPPRRPSACLSARLSARRPSARTRNICNNISNLYNLIYCILILI